MLEEATTIDTQKMIFLSATLRFTNEPANRLAAAKKLLLTVAISPLVNFLIKSHVSVKFGLHPAVPLSFD